MDLRPWRFESSLRHHLESYRSRDRAPDERDTKADLEGAMLDWFMRTSDTVPVGGDPRRFPAVSAVQTP